MYQLTGEYECRIDAKGRIRLPSSLVRQLGGKKLSFTLNRGFEKHLILYPKEVWDRKKNEIDRLNIYDTRHRQVIRYFYRGATEIILDKSDRILLPKSLTDYAEIESEIFLFAYQDQVEIWSKVHYEKMIGLEPEDFSSIAHDVFSGERTGEED